MGFAFTSTCTLAPNIVHTRRLRPRRPTLLSIMGTEGRRYDRGVKITKS